MYVSACEVLQAVMLDMNWDGKTDLLVGQLSGAVLLHLNNTK